MKVAGIGRDLLKRQWQSQQESAFRADEGAYSMRQRGVYPLYAWRLPNADIHMQASMKRANSHE